MEKPRGVLVAGTGCIYHLRDRVRVNHMNFLARNDHRSFLRSGQGGNRAIFARVLQSRVEIVDFVERKDFRFIGEQNIDVAAYEFAKRVAMAVDTKRIG